MQQSKGDNIVNMHLEFIEHTHHGANVLGDVDNDDANKSYEPNTNDMAYKSVHRRHDPQIERFKNPPKILLKPSYRRCSSLV